MGRLGLLFLLRRLRCGRSGNQYQVRNAAAQGHRDKTKVRPPSLASCDVTDELAQDILVIALEVEPHNDEFGEAGDVVFGVCACLLYGVIDNDGDRLANPVIQTLDDFVAVFYTGIARHPPANFPLTT